MNTCGARERKEARLKYHPGWRPAQFPNRTALLFRDIPVEGFGNATGYRGECVTVATQRDSVSNGALVRGGIQKGNDRLGYSDFLLLVTCSSEIYSKSRRSLGSAANSWSLSSGGPGSRFSNQETQEIPERRSPTGPALPFPTAPITVPDP